VVVDVCAAENHHQSLIEHRKLRLGGITAIRIAEFVRASDLNRALGIPDARANLRPWIVVASLGVVPHGYSNVVSDDSK
jgi:hypothetical protein